MATTAATELLTRAAEISATSVDVDRRTATVIWSTGSRVRRGGGFFSEPVFEELSLDAGHVDLSRLASGRAPLLNSHAAYDANNVIGVVESARIERGQGVAVVRFADDPASESIFRKVATGVLRNISVGYTVATWQRLQEQQDGLPVLRAVSWAPYELSIVSVGADAGAFVRSLSEDSSMTTPQTQTTVPDQAAPMEAERARATEITRIVGIARLEPALAQRMIGDGLTVENARSMIFDELVRRQNDTPLNNKHVEFGEDRTQGRSALMVEALHARFGGPAPSNDAREFMHMRVVDMARHGLETRGVSTRMMSPNQVIQRALHTTSDFPELLGSAGERFLRTGYDSYQGGVRRICKESTAKDFRAKSMLMLSEAPELLALGEGGEVKRGTMAESTTSYSLATFGRIFGISRQALVNDDLGAFADMTAKLGRSAAEFIATQLSTKLSSNPTLGDSIALFHASHANLGTAGVISVTTLGEGLKKMRLQTGLDGVTPIDVTPKYLIVPAALEVVARQYVALINATKASDVNPFTADLEVVVDPRLDGVSATAWYLAADASAVDTIEYSFLEGEPGPVIETRAGFDVEGVEIKVRLDFGCGVIDHRGLFKNAGA